MKKHKKYYYCSLIGLLILFTCILFSGKIHAGSDEVVAFDSLEVQEPPVPAFEIQEIAVSETNNREVEILTLDISEPKSPETEQPEEPKEHDITLMAVGDNLLHMGIVNTGKQADGTRNYDFLFDGIRPLLEAADIKIINQETIFGGNQLGFHGYPKFNSPSEVSDAIAKAGFNIVLQATNHTADQGLQGIQNCIDLWKTHPEVHIVGLHEPIIDQTQSRITLMEIDGCTFAFLNYTYGPNNTNVPAAIADRLDILCAVNETNRTIDFTSINPQVLTDIAEADTLADIVVVCPHWGTEYAAAPSSYQEKFAMQMTEAGADIIIGTHPHVVQPISWIEADNGNRSLCYYSLGNYVSTQKNAKSMLEGLAWVTIHVTERGASIEEENTGVIPLVCHYSSSPVRLKNVYLLENYTEELASSHGIISYGGVSFHLDSLQNWSKEVFGSWVLLADQIEQRDGS